MTIDERAYLISQWMAWLDLNEKLFKKGALYNSEQLIS